VHVAEGASRSRSRGREACVVTRELVVYLVVALICGLLGQMVAGRSLGGYLVSTSSHDRAVVGSALANAIAPPSPS